MSLLLWHLTFHIIISLTHFRTLQPLINLFILIDFLLFPCRNASVLVHFQSFRLLSLVVRSLFSISHTFTNIFFHALHFLSHFLFSFASHNFTGYFTISLIKFHYRLSRYRCHYYYTKTSSCCQYQKDRWQNSKHRTNIDIMGYSSLYGG